MAASCGLEGASRVLDYKALLDDAIAISEHKPQCTIIKQVAPTRPLPPALCVANVHTRTRTRTRTFPQAAPSADGFHDPWCRL